MMLPEAMPGIFVAKFPNDYRVTIANNIEQCIDVPEELAELYKVLYFNSGSSHTTLEDALTEAENISENMAITNYGIKLLDFDQPLLDISPSIASARLDEFYYRLYGESLTS